MLTLKIWKIGLNGKPVSAREIGSSSPDHFDRMMDQAKRTKISDNEVITLTNFAEQKVFWIKDGNAIPLQ